MRWVYSSCSNNSFYLHQCQNFPRNCVAGQLGLPFLLVERVGSGDKTIAGLS